MCQSLTLTATQKQPKHILVVEDNGPLRFTLAEWLRLSNYVVFEAASADEAVMLLESPLVIDLVITDVQMPGRIDGFDLVRHIQAGFPKLGVIVVSANNFHTKFKEKNIQFFIKPYNLDTISSHIERLLSDSNPQKELKNE